jgi:hypothetical protein
MKLFVKFIVTVLSLVVAVSALGYFFWYKPKLLSSAIINNIPARHIIDNKAELFRLQAKATFLKEYLAENNFNTDYCFMVDMRIPSGKKRFFVFNLKKDSIEKAGLVTHGSGSSKGDSLIFSNVTESKCTSIGKYKIGKSYNGKFGLAYKLYGLDKTNSNVFKRFVVLHSHPCVPGEEIYPLRICVSYGCPTVAPYFLNGLRPYLDQSKKPVLLWIFY